MPAGTKAQAIVLWRRKRGRRWCDGSSPTCHRACGGSTVTAGKSGRLLPNSLGVRGYSGPCAPPGTDLAVAFTFHVYALDRPLRLAADASLDQAFDALNARSVAEGELSGGYDPR